MSDRRVLDYDAQRAIAAEGARFIEALLTTMFSLVKSLKSFERLTTSGDTSWKLILDSARALHVHDSIVQNSQSRILRMLCQEEPSSTSATPSLFSGQAAAIREWDVTRVVEFIESEGYEQLIEQFRENEVDGATFLELSHDDLKEDFGIEEDEVITRILALVAAMH